jgi:hypothetical protein
MQSGVYRKLHGKTGVGDFYQFLHLARHHTTGDEYVVYIPLRVEPEWAGTVRPCILERFDFEVKFTYVGEGLPEIICPNCLQEGRRNERAETAKGEWNYYCPSCMEGWDALPEVKP